MTWKLMTLRTSVLDMDSFQSVFYILPSLLPSSSFPSLFLTPFFLPSVLLTSPPSSSSCLPHYLHLSTFPLPHLPLTPPSSSLHLSSEEEDDEYSDDDDVSWKVRRASAKCLTVILGSRLEMLTDFYQTISPVLIARFKGECGADMNCASHYSVYCVVEREENVKTDIFTAYRALLTVTQSQNAAQSAGDGDGMEVSDR